MGHKMRIYKFISCLPFVVALSACGKWAGAGSESVTTLPIPEYPKIQDDVFSLNSSKAKTEYKGTLIIFNDATSPELLAKVINASVAARDAWGDIKKFEVESSYVGNYTDGGYAFKNIELMREGLQAFEIEALNKNPISQAAKVENARTWISREIDSLNLTAEQKETFENQWGAYCEAKVIEFATHPVASSTGFKSFPYPSALCQDYYGKNGFFTGESCQNPSDGDYTKCLWSEGILKTRWFAVPTNDEALATKRLEKRTRLIDLLNDSNYVSTRGVLNFTPSSFNLGASAAFKKLYYDKKEAFVTIALDQKNDNTCTRVIANTGSQDVCRVFGIAPDLVSPRQVISAVEGNTVDEKLFARLPAPAAPRTVTTQQILRYLGERIRAENSTGDRLFVETSDGSLLSQPTFASAGKDFNEILPQVRQILGPEFYGRLGEQDVLRKQDKLDAINTLEADILTKRATWDRLNQNIADTTDTGISAANAGNVAVGFAQYQMTFDQIGPILQARWFMQEARSHVFQACFDLSKYETSNCVLPEKADITYHPATLKLSENGARLDFSLTVDDPAAEGFDHKDRHDEDRKPDFFMDLNRDSWTNRTLRFELYRNRIKGCLDIMTGKAFVEKDGQKEFEGAISSWEQAD